MSKIICSFVPTALDQMPLPEPGRYHATSIGVMCDEKQREVTLAGKRGAGVTQKPQEEAIGAHGLRQLVFTPPRAPLCPLRSLRAFFHGIEPGPTGIGYWRGGVRPRTRFATRGPFAAKPLNRTHAPTRAGRRQGGREHTRSTVLSAWTQPPTPREAVRTALHPRGASSYSFRVVTCAAAGSRTQNRRMPPRVFRTQARRDGPGPSRTAPTSTPSMFSAFSTGPLARGHRSGSPEWGGRCRVGGAGSIKCERTDHARRLPDAPPAAHVSSPTYIVTPSGQPSARVRGRVFMHAPSPLSSQSTIDKNMRLHAVNDKSGSERPNIVSPTTSVHLMNIFVAGLLVGLGGSALDRAAP